VQRYSLKVGLSLLLVVHTAGQASSGTRRFSCHRALVRIARRQVCCWLIRETQLSSCHKALDTIIFAIQIFLTLRAIMKRSKDVISIMFYKHRKIRAIVATSLALSLGIGGFCPMPLAGAASGVQTAPQHCITSCCCYEVVGECCGLCNMACCVSKKAPAKQPTQRPGNDENRNSRSNLLAYTLIKLPFGCNETTGSSLFTTDGLGTKRCLAESTLQARHVRLDA